MPPTANAGNNENITLPTNNVTLSGSGKDADGNVASYEWIKVSGPTSGTINNANSASANINNLSEGVYQFEFIVTDNKEAIGKDTVQVTVNPAPNMPPIADAGRDVTIVSLENIVYLNGSGNDIDGTITAYQWKQIAGPASSSITTDDKPSTEVKRLVAGSYEFELTVMDNNGETGSDTVQVVVALARVSAEANSVKIYPNPVKDIATVEINSANLNAQLTLVILDFAGKTVYKKKLNAAGNYAVVKINMSDFAMASYTALLLFDNGSKLIFPIIKL
jgi:hypothetical protein